MNRCHCLILLLVSSINTLVLASDGNPMMDSMPRLEGEISMKGLYSGVEIARDALSIPSIRGTNLPDVIRAQGYLHAQERYVQMDMSRRIAAGELAELVGSMMIASDRRYRRYQFRQVARQVVAQLPEVHLGLLEIYVEGVNAGLADLGAVPPEP